MSCNFTAVQNMSNWAKHAKIRTRDLLVEAANARTMINMMKI